MNVLVKTDKGEEFYVPVSKLEEYSKKHNIVEITQPTEHGAKTTKAPKGSKLVAKGKEEHNKVFGYFKDVEGKIHWTTANAGTTSIAGAKFHPTGNADLEITPYGLRPHGWNIAKEIETTGQIPVRIETGPVKKSDIEKALKREINITTTKHGTISNEQLLKQMKEEKEERELAKIWEEKHGKLIERSGEIGGPVAKFFMTTSESAGITQAEALILSPELREKTFGFITKYPEKTFLKGVQSIVATPFSMVKDVGEKLKAGDVPAVAGMSAGFALQVALLHEAGRGINLLQEKIPTTTEVEISLNKLRGINIMEVGKTEARSLGLFELKEPRIKGNVFSLIKERKGGEITIDTKLTIPEQKIGNVKVKQMEKMYFGKVIKKGKGSVMSGFSNKVEDEAIFKLNEKIVNIDEKTKSIEGIFNLDKVERKLVGEERVLTIGKEVSRMSRNGIEISHTKGFSLRGTREGVTDLTGQDWVNIIYRKTEEPKMIKPFKSKSGDVVGAGKLESRIEDVKLNVPDEGIKLKVSGRKSEISKLFTDVRPSKTTNLKLMFPTVSLFTRNKVKKMVREKPITKLQLPLKNKQGIVFEKQQIQKQTQRYDLMIRQVELQKTKQKTRTVTETKTLTETEITSIGLPAPTTPQIGKGVLLPPVALPSGLVVGKSKGKKKKYGVKMILNPLPELKEIL